MHSKLRMLVTTSAMTRHWEVVPEAQRIRTFVSGSVEAMGRRTHGQSAVPVEQRSMLRARSSPHPGTPASQPDTLHQSTAAAYGPAGNWSGQHPNQSAQIYDAGTVFRQ